MASNGSANPLGDETGVIVDWLLKLLVVLGLVGVVAVEAGGIFFARYNAAEGASDAASQAALGLRTNGTAGDPKQLATQAALRRGCELVSLHRDLETKIVFATVERKARTFFIHDVEQLKRFTVVRASDSASYDHR